MKKYGNFRQAVVRIICETRFKGDCDKCKNCYGYPDCPKQEQIDAVCAEVGKMANKLDKYKEKNANNVAYTDHDGNKRVEKCQSWLKEQVKEVSNG